MTGLKPLQILLSVLELQPRDLNVTTVLWIALSTIVYHMQYALHPVLPLLI